ncbi:hypothetical protein E4T85_00040 [Bacillus stratosphericus]|uniref:DUF6944 family repetitive protein n=1 Tax=Bacillus aerius TaxID=293388 RepID=UPI001072CA2B|nr:hypothetical protein [Bacillus aerius]MDH6598405.1 hypothetical protein [Bacillus aerius]TFV12237.1 hypothetical protein E4T85_00040 [Bacillus stratosphericus]
MDNKSKKILGSFLSMIGTIQSALGSTPDFPLDEEQRYQFDIIGNTLQAVGSGLSADGQESDFMGAVGDQIQATGNSTVLVGLLIYKKDNPDLAERVVISGNWLQALGSFVGLEFNENENISVLESNIGGILQGIGNSLQAIGGIETLRPNVTSFKDVGTLGSWIQAIGSVISFLVEVSDE